MLTKVSALTGAAATMATIAIAAILLQLRMVPLRCILVVQRIIAAAERVASLNPEKPPQPRARALAFAASMAARFDARLIDLIFPRGRPDFSPTSRSCASI